MTFNPHTEEDRAEMLETIGVDSIEALFTPVPDSIRFPDLDLAPQLTEVEAARHLADLAAKNVVAKPEDIYLGAGSYQHYVPATVGQILSRGEFYTAYTPYQPEVSQGTLQVIYEFQTFVAELFGMEVANASMYDGATALAEAALIGISSQKKKNRIVIANTVHPSYKDVISTYVESTGIDVVRADSAKPFFSTVDDLKEHFSEDLACVVVQYPNFFGQIEDIEAIAEAVHEAGGLLVVSTTPVPLGLLKTPGELGADVVAAEGQPLGVAQSYGGPYVGLLATRQKYVRQMPGRLAGVTTDSTGERGFVLTLQTREQHIRREKATSNICTNQGLMATAATVYMASLGPEGFREVSNASYQNAHYLASEIGKLPGYDIVDDGPFFHEFVVRTDKPAADVLKALADEGILGGFDLGRFNSDLDHALLICTTELNNKKGMDRMVAVLSA